MSTRSADYMEALDRLPDGAALVVQDVPWEDYEELLENLLSRPGVRVTYDQGRLEIMSPLPEHERWKRFIERVIDTVSDELDINVEPLGSTTWKKKQDAKGAEADTCYYVANADQIIGKRDIDLSVDPPPDLVVEIDSTNDSASKFPIYATFGVPEIWRYGVKHHHVSMYQLREKTYVEIPSSLSFPILTPAILANLIDQAKAQDQKTILAAFRRDIRDKKERG